MAPERGYSTLDEWLCSKDFLLQPFGWASAYRTHANTRSNESKHGNWRYMVLLWLPWEWYHEVKTRNCVWWCMLLVSILSMLRRLKGRIFNWCITLNFKMSRAYSMGQLAFSSKIFGVLNDIKEHRTKGTALKDIQHGRQTNWNEHSVNLRAGRVITRWWISFPFRSFTIAAISINLHAVHSKHRRSSLSLSLKRFPEWHRQKKFISTTRNCRIHSTSASPCEQSIPGRLAPLLVTTLGFSANLVISWPKASVIEDEAASLEVNRNPDIPGLHKFHETFSAANAPQGCILRS